MLMHSMFKCLKVVHTIRDTPPNVHGIMDLTTANDSESYLAYPGSIDDGRGSRDVCSRIRMCLG
uniref:Uncharacterized protein n=1 Tax=Ascaris lumbricoides TaxID=6252 RepID=A0A0M3HLY2_ASCLU